MIPLLVVLTLVILWNLSGFIGMRMDPTYEKGDFKNPLFCLLTSFGLIILGMQLTERYSQRKHSQDQA